MAITATSMFVIGCATPSYNYVPTTESFSRPPIGDRTVATVGDRMLAQGQVTERDALKVSESFKISGYSLTPGFFPKTGEDENSVFFSFLPSPMNTGDGNTLGGLQKGVLMDPAASLEFEKETGKICVVTVFNLHTCRDRSERFEITKFVQAGDSSFQQTLYYNGRVANKINIGYREYSGSMARPAFSNEVEYDLSVSDEFSYRGAKIKVFNANNNQIEYEVLKNFRGVN
ncbi:hypothetical protein [Henriciella sp.]|uniref:hypothetical protein n=1 Tax=Henriciella sp. TaxID=1968823 RepID=UPI00261D8ABA|nr:hypothetical protein [Henriciella sp.]